MLNKNQNSKKTTEKLLSKFKHKWEQSLIDIARKVAEKMGIEIPENLKPAKAAYFLEEITESNLESKKGKIQFLILSGVSAAGKGTIGKELEKRGILRLPRATTRFPRPEEKDGVDYLFITKEQFEKIEKEGGFLQVAKTFHQYRGTPKDKFKKLIDEKKMFYVEGSHQTYDEFINHPEVKKVNHLSIDILPPNFEEYFKRLTNREDNIDLKEIKARLEKAIKHLYQTITSPYDGYIVNDKAERAADQIQYYCIKN